MVNSDISKFIISVEWVGGRTVDRMISFHLAFILIDGVGDFFRTRLEEPPPTQQNDVITGDVCPPWP